MMKFTARPFQGPGDIAEMRKMLVSTRRSVGFACWHVGDLTWRLFLQSVLYPLQDTLRLWFAGDRLVGFAVFDPPRRATAGFDAQVHPEARGQGIEEQMVDWVVGQAQVVPACERLVADPGIYEEDTALAHALERRGFLSSGGSSILCRSLEGSSDENSPPSGFTIRAILPYEIETRAKAHRDVFAPSRVGDLEYSRLVRMPGYETGLDLVAVTRAGEIAAFALGWMDTENRVGEFEPVGTRPEFRSKGAARAVMAEGMRRMRARGATSVFVGPIEREDSGALAFYERIGLSHCCSLLSLVWEKS